MWCKKSLEFEIVIKYSVSIQLQITKFVYIFALIGPTKIEISFLSELTVAYRAALCIKCVYKVMHKAK